ncbi:hypothetical protein ACV344_07135 [Pseudomonas aeruginosa]|uniref:hypothetical protein n=1 Tax=Pseudomonas aeruginosa TaxID=287 RepID=UPI00117B8347|nr:hypothetical protein [Pseudomonas aeruginosa]TRP03768.1 hypothetical protein FNL66_15030 [Pseudomonas aeruginosa]HCD5831270.1 hypothetical protein [Pseudomonas aeruginosa]HCD6465351.1 hypothetical protein [Pseudomonas aeruginosa]HCF7385819.1 hypothetical protein [Pseudomonas aeruginosa]
MTDINRAKSTRNLDAYYYGFDPTGCDLVDSVLEQVARAGKAFHSTDDWNEEDLDGLSPVDKMQAAANASAKTIMALIAEVEHLRRFAAEVYQVLGAMDAPENVLDNASDAANGVPLRHETLLPFFAEDYEALCKDAARYRWLRERDLETIRQGGVFAGMTPENIVLNQEDLDAAIDAALEGATQ